MSTDSNIAKQNKLKENLPIIAILAFAVFLNIWNIWIVDFANKYYAAGVYSMGQNLHAFFFNSFDSQGFITIDKPPLGFWIQVIFTKIFGFSGTVLVLPQAIASVVSVYLIYRIIKKRFSKGAGLIAAAVLAITPIFVAVSRNNTIDGIMILFLVLAASQALVAAENASMKHLVLAGVFIGLGFNVKMLQAYMIVPAIYLTYLIFAKQKFLKKILVCAVSVIVMVIISLSWVVAVDLVPEENRPYVGSSTENSAVELALGYNGINRIFRGGNITGSNNTSQNTQPNNAVQNNDPNRNDNQQAPISQNNNQQTAPNKTGSNRTGGGESGEAGFFRLYNEENAGQIGWFILPAVFVCVFMLILIFNGKFKSNEKNIVILFFALCFIPMFIYFSFASGLAHRYYFATFAPFIAGLIGIGFYYLVEGKNYWFSIVFIPAAVAQLYIQYLYNDWMKAILPITALIFAASAIVILIAVIKKISKKVIIALMCTLLILPSIWSLTPMMYNDNSQLPIAGPEITMGGDYFDIKLDYSELVAYLEENREGADYLVMTPSSMTLGAELILQSGEPVMALGGFNGGDTPVTLDEFIDIVKNNEVRYAILENDTDKANKEIYRWIRQNGTIIRPYEYGRIGINLITVYRLN